MSDRAVLLRAEGVGKRFGGFVALQSVDIELRAGERLGLIGPNGSGKSTFVNCLSGDFATHDGRVTLGGHALGGLKPHRRARLGLARTFQLPQPFGSLSVLENVRVPVLFAGQAGSATARAMDCLEQVEMAGKADCLPKELTQVRPGRPWHALPGGLPVGIRLLGLPDRRRGDRGRPRPSIWDTFSPRAGRDRRRPDRRRRVRPLSPVPRGRRAHGPARREGLPLQRQLATGPARRAPARRTSAASTSTTAWSMRCSRPASQPLVNLYHWDLPQALQDRGGFADPRGRGWFTDYADAGGERGSAIGSPTG